MGNVRKIEVVVRVDDTMNENQRSDFATRLRGCEGVEYACFTPGRGRLLLIDYDRDRLHALDVLGYVRELHTAELVGTI